MSWRILALNSFGVSFSLFGSISLPFFCGFCYDIKRKTHWLVLDKDQVIRMYMFEFDRSYGFSLKE